MTTPRSSCPARSPRPVVTGPEGPIEVIVSGT
jgi:hypothetical protein